MSRHTPVVAGGPCRARPDVGRGTGSGGPGGARRPPGRGGMAAGLAAALTVVGGLALGLLVLAHHPVHLFGAGAPATTRPPSSAASAAPATRRAAPSAAPSAVSPASVAPPPSAPPAAAGTVPPTTLRPGAAASPQPGRAGGRVLIPGGCDAAVRAGLYPAGSPLDRACRAKNGRVGL